VKRNFCKSTTVASTVASVFKRGTKKGVKGYEYAPGGDKKRGKEKFFLIFFEGSGSEKKSFRYENRAPVAEVEMVIGNRGKKFYKKWKMRLYNFYYYL
jgi:hypothetical protein